MKSLLLHKLRARSDDARRAVRRRVGDRDARDRRGRERGGAGADQGAGLDQRDPAQHEAAGDRAGAARRPRGVAYGLTDRRLRPHRARRCPRRTWRVVPVREHRQDLRAGAPGPTARGRHRCPEYLESATCAIARRPLADAASTSSASRNVAVLGATSRGRCSRCATRSARRSRSADYLHRRRRARRLGRESGASEPSLDSCVFIPLTTSRERFGDEIRAGSSGSMERERVELHEIKVKLRVDRRRRARGRGAPRMLGLETGRARQRRGTSHRAARAPARSRGEQADLQHRARLDRRDHAARRRHRHHERDARDRDRAHARDRHPARARRASAAHRPQFLVETVVLSVGGALGVALGLVIPARDAHPRCDARSTRRR